jgi:hypothetical protein
LTPLVTMGNGGIDTVRSTIGYTLGVNLEKLTLVGNQSLRGNGNVLDNVVRANDAGDTLFGDAGNDTLIGGAGNDVLDGGMGIDSLVGGAGDDTLQLSVDGLFGGSATTSNIGSPGHGGGGGAFALVGRHQSRDLFDGGDGIDTLLGTAGSDAVILEDLISPPVGVPTMPRLTSIERIATGAGDDVVDLTSQRFAYGDVVVDGGTGNDVLWSSSGNDYLKGGLGNDIADGGWGNDVIDGGAGDDTLIDLAGNNLVLGGAGNDVVTVGTGHNLVAGGAGADVIRTGAGRNIIAFDRGDGTDTVVTGAASANTLSLGKGIAYADLSLRRSGSDLVLDAGNGDAVTFRDWYADNANRTTKTLQFFKEGSSDYAPGSGDVTRSQKVETFDFAKLAAAADASRNAQPWVLQPLSRWNLSQGLLTAFLGASNTAALGGDLAYQYGSTGSLDGNWLGSTRSTLGSSQFGESAQSLQKPMGGVESGDLKLMA